MECVLIDTYIKGIEEDCRAFETEYLDPTTRYNEFIITTIRTVWGTPIEKLKQMFGNEMWEYCQKMAAPYLKMVNWRNTTGLCA